MLRQLVTDPSERRPTFDSRLVRVRFVVDMVSLAEVSVSSFRRFPVIIFPPVPIRIFTSPSSIISVWAYALTIFASDSFVKKKARFCLRRRA